MPHPPSPDAYHPVRLAADLRPLSAGERRMLPLLFAAAVEMDAVFWEQAYGDRAALLASLADPAQRRLAEIHYGPWDPLDGNRPFVDGAGAKPPEPRRSSPATPRCRPTWPTIWPASTAPGSPSTSSSSRGCRCVRVWEYTGPGRKKTTALPIRKPPTHAHTQTHPDTLTPGHAHTPTHGAYEDEASRRLAR